MYKQHSYVIIGNGITGVTAAEILREYDPASSITMIADDPFPAYYRPALKDFLGGRLPEEKLWARPATFYKERRLRFLPARVMKIHPAQQTLQLHNGATVRYETLLLANGARARTLECPGLNLAGVSTLRTVADYQEILHRLEHVRRVVVCGSGTLALESAETLRHSGYEVTHLLRGKLLWSEVLDPVAADMVLQEERRAGIEVRCEEEIARVVGNGGQVSGVLTTRGEHIPCELVLIAIGIEPLIDFIRAGGIVCGRGVKVDETMRTNVSGIYAAGDAIETVDRFSGRTRVLGQWFPAIQQAQIAAYNMLAAAGRAQADVSSLTSGQFYNATFLYGLDFVSLGLTICPAMPGFQELVAAPQARSYRKAILYRGQAAGVLLLGDRRQALAWKRAIDHRVNLTPVAHQLFAEDFDLDAWLSARGAPEPLLTLQSTGTTDVWEPAAGTPALVPGRSQALSQESEASFVPIPDSRVRLATREMLIPRASPGQVLTIGRQPGVFWLIDHSSVSRLHAEVVCNDGAWMLRDTGSSNGTYVNGSPLPRGGISQLSPQDEVRFGDVRFRFEVRPRSALQQHAGAPALANFAHLHGSDLHSSASRLIPEALVASLPATPTLVLVGTDGPVRTLALNHGQRYQLGRDPQNDIVLPDVSTSRRHAEIFGTPDGFSIRDLNSRYGVFVNQVKITNSYHLSHSDRIVLGNMLLYFSHPQACPQEPAAAATLITRQAVALTAESKSATRRQEKHPQVVGMEHRATEEPLSQKRLKFEIDMCIGCNRCMEACPVPMSSQVSIATLNAATITQDITPIVARFTHECVMCGSCVPVCPVDNHRDLLMLALKQRLGVAWKDQPDMSRVIQVLPAGWPLPMLLERLREQSVFCDSHAIPDTYLLHMVAAASRRVLSPGEELVHEGEYGRDLYVILEGRLELITTDREQAELAIALLQRGEYVGEDGLLTGQPYKATVRAPALTLLLQVPEQVVQNLMELVPEVRRHFERFTRARSLYTLLTHMDLFEGVTHSDLQALARAAPIRHYDRGERLFAEDPKGRPSRETVHILLEGFVKVARRVVRGGKDGERIIAYRQGGDYFAGGLDLLGDGQAVTVAAINRCRVAQVPRQTVLGLFERYPALEQRFALRLRKYLAAATATRDDLRQRALPPYVPEVTPADPRVQTGLHDLVSNGVVEGTEVLIIDLDKCIHCNECEYACERRHGHSRMNRKGMVIGNISITTTCRQCQDPVCMLCSRAGIARHPNGEVYITASCIGCGICAERCPYGAISIVSTDEEPATPNPWRRFSEWFARGSGQGRAPKMLPMLGQSAASGHPGESDHHPVRGGYEQLRKKLAIKCDLCAGYRDQACVEACPAGAAMRIHPTRFFGSTEQILQRQAK